MPSRTGRGLVRLGRAYGGRRMQYAGIDVGKEACHATVLDQEGQVRHQFELPNKPSGWRKFEKLLQPGDRLALEASTHAYPIHDHFRSHGFDVVAAHPRGVKVITQADSKTDRKDSHHLAHLLRTDYLPKAYIPHPDVLRLRDLLRARVDAGRTSTRIKNHLHAYLARNGLRPPVSSNNLFQPIGLAWLRKPHWNDSRDALVQLGLHEWDSIQERQKILEIQLAKVAVQNPDVQLLMTVKGLDFYLALLITTEIGELSRFPNYESFQSYGGCAPRVRESAGINRGGGAVQSRCGNLKWALSMATERLITYENPIRAYYLEQLRRVHKKQRAKARARRKVAAMVYAILKTRRPCKWAQAANVDFKMRKMRNLSRKETGL